MKELGERYQVKRLYRTSNTKRTNSFGDINPNSILIVGGTAWHIIAYICNIK